MEREKECIYFRGYYGMAMARELFGFVRKNSGVRSLLPLIIERCDKYVNKAGVRVRPGLGISERLIRLQSLINGKFEGCIIHEGVTRKLKTGIGITLALPGPEGYVNMKKLNKARFVSSVRLDLAWRAESPYSQDPLKTYVKSGTQLLAAIGLTEIDKWGRIIGEDLDGVRLFLDDRGRCFGSEIKFNGLDFSIPKKIFQFDKSYQFEINQFQDGLTRLSFLPKGESPLLADQGFHFSPVLTNFDFCHHWDRKF